MLDLNAAINRALKNNAKYKRRRDRGEDDGQEKIDALTAVFDAVARANESGDPVAILVAGCLAKGLDEIIKADILVGEENLS